MNETGIRVDSGTLPYRRLLGTLLVDDTASGLPQLHSLVRGEAVAGAGESSLSRTSPATGDTLFAAAPLDRAQVDDAVASAQQALTDPGWKDATGQQRQRWLLEIAAAVDAWADELAATIVYETGKPIREADGEVQAAVNSFEFFAALARDVNGTVVTRGPGDRWGLKLPEPAGVAGLVSPWNFPLAVLCQKLPPALAAGCPCVIKPSPLTPLTALALGQLIASCDIPTFSVQVLLGDQEVGDHLVSHPDVDVVSFTGSSGTGRAVAQAAQRHRLKPVAVEGTGNAPLLVAADADPELAAAGAVTGAFFMQGECCVGTARLIVHHSLVSQFRAAFLERTRQMVVGDPFDRATDMGPIISAGAGDRLTRLIGDATAAGATVCSGQSQPSFPGHLPGGPYWHPTLVEDVPPDGSLVEAETFGPIATLQTFDSVEEGVALANASAYGLGASVWTYDMRTARQLSERIQAGIVWVNGVVDSYPELTLSGHKDSGIGVEFGRQGLEFFLANKTVHYVNA